MTTTPAVVRPAVARTRAELTQARAALPGSVAVVMTMGALHQGHLALLQRAREVADHVILTIFVNPLQFGPAEDFADYPRDSAADLRLVEAAGGADIVFVPSGATMYPAGSPGVTVAAGPAGQVLEGRLRPGHFDGVLTVVALLLHLTRADVAVFGEKDAQQVSLVRQLVSALAFGVRIETVPTVREPDGLARSSRNVRLSTQQREAAAAVPRALAAAAAAGRGAARDAALVVLRGAPGLTVDYVDIVDPVDFAPVGTGHTGSVLLVLAVRAGSTRLIDNVVLAPVGTAGAGPTAAVN